MRKYTRLPLLIVTTLACVGFVCLLAVIRRREVASDNLLARATRVAETADWASPFARSRGNAPPYFWRNDHEILHYTPIPNNEPGALALVLLDIRTGATRPVRANGEDTVLAANERGLSVSPDGAQLLCSGMKIGPVSLFTVALDGSGARRRTWPVSYDGQGTFWDVDSRGFVRFAPPVFGKPWQALRYHLDQPGAAPDLIAASALPPAFNPYFIAPLRPGVYLVYNSSTKLRSTQSRYSELTLPPPGATKQASHLREMVLEAPKPKRGGRGALFGGMMPLVSPQGNRLLWVETREPPPVRVGAHFTKSAAVAVASAAWNAFPVSFPSGVRYFGQWRSRRQPGLSGRSSRARDAFEQGQRRSDWLLFHLHAKPQVVAGRQANRVLAKRRAVCRAGPRSVS